MTDGVNILAIDGGGIRGIIPARVLQEIETRMRRPAASIFHLMAGTSTGGIIALGLAAPVAGTAAPANSAADLLEIYVDQGRVLFPDSWTLEVKTLHGLREPRYPSRPVEALFRQRFGELMMSDALTEVVIPAYDLTTPGPYFFKRSYARLHPDGAPSDWDVAMREVARATSAAPTYFEPACLPPFPQEPQDHDHALVDGGLFANNPCACAYADALGNAEWRGREVRVLSLGTGSPTRHADGVLPVTYEQAHGWGLAHWARPVLAGVQDGGAKAVEYEMERSCAVRPGELRRYHRLQSDLPTASHHLDDASSENIARLLADAAALIAEADADGELDAICAMLSR